MPNLETKNTNGNKDTKIFLVDGSGYIFRAYHALPPLTREDGTPVGAVYGFVNMIIRLWKTLKNHPILVVFDASRITFRQDIYPEYKAHRPPPPEDLIPQFTLIREACSALGLPYVEDKNYEADDLIASYAKACTKKNHKVVIISSDKDLMQLVTDDVSMYDPMKNKPINTEQVIEKFGVSPHHVIDVQSLAGDSVDNIPGVPGIGIKTAAQLIQEFGSLDNLLANAHTIKQPKRREKLVENKKEALLSRRLVTLHQDVPLPLPLEELKPLHSLNGEKTTSFLKDQNFTTLINRFSSVISTTPSPIYNSTPSLKPTENKVQPLKFDTCIISNIDDLRSWVDKARERGFFAVDTETTSLDVRTARLVGISLAIPGENKAAYIPIAHQVDLLSDSKYTQLTIEDIQPILAPIFSDEATLKIGQNIKYDQHILYRNRMPLSPIADTLIMAYLIEGSLQSLSLEALAHRYFGYEMQSFKNLTKKGNKQKTFDEIPIEQAAFYAAEDAYVTARLFSFLTPQLIQKRQLNVYEKLERPLIDVLFSMEMDGILVDKVRLNKVGQDLGQQAAQLSEIIYKKARNTQFNIASTQQLSQVLFEDLKLPTKAKKGKNGAYSTSADVLENLSHQGHTIADDILRWRQLVKLKNTYTDSLITLCNPKTDRVHTSFGMISTSTGRLSSSNPNLQNIPIRTSEGRLIRQTFISPPGKKLVSFDYSQIELRLLAHVANIPTLIEAFKKGLDIHTKTAAQVFNIKQENITPHQRRQAKAINFGIIYGISAYGLAKQLSIDTNQAQSYIDTYFKTYPGIQAYMHKVIDEAQHKGYVSTLFNRRCYIHGLRDKNQQKRQMAERQAINAPLQGSAADIIKKAMIEIHLKIKANNLNASMLLQVHDELVFEVEEQQVQDLINFIKPIMEKAILLSIPLVVDHGIGTNWDECH